MSPHLLRLAASSTPSTFDHLAPIVLQIVHEETGAHYAEQTLATITLLNSITPSSRLRVSCNNRC